MSFSQERLWYLEKLMPGNIAYNIPVAVQLTGPLDVSALQQSLNLVIQRHEVLRATFDLEADQPVQTIKEEVVLPVPVEGWNSDQDLSEALLAEAQRPFNLQTGPLLRAKLLEMGPENHIFLFTIHHIVADGWSLAVLFKEVSSFYAALIDGKTAEIPIPIQYPDFALWQKQRLSGDLLNNQMAYWKTQLGGDLTEIKLPLDAPRPTTPSFRGRWLSRSLPPAQVKALKKLAMAEGTTLFVTLLAAFKTLLYRYSGQDEILVGSPVTNRIQHELENVIGHFINTLVLRTDLSGRITFRELLKRQKAVVLDAYTNQDIPFEYLLETLQPARDPRKNPLFQVAFNLQDVPAQAYWRSALNLPGVKAKQLFTHTQTAKLDLTLEIEELDGELIFSFEYNTDIFSAETIERMAGHLLTLIPAVTANPDRLLSEFPLMTAEEHQLLRLWNEQASSFPENRCIHSIFEDHAANQPEAIALLQNDRQLTYGELNDRANQIAQQLRQLGVGPDVAVGICANRSFAFITGILAILKAGGAYVPMDINYPQERISYMLENSQAPVLLLESTQSGNITHETGTTILLDEMERRHPAGGPPPKTLSSNVKAQNLACIIFTSGSTGRPKGVAIPHYAINRMVLNTNYMEFKSDDVLAHLSSTAFDAATYEIWGAMLNGLPLAIVSRETALVPDELAAFLERNGVTVLFIITSLFNQMAYNRPDAYSRLRVVMFGGEACDPQAVRIVSKQNAPQRLLHMYGPAESTTYASWYPVSDVPDGARTVPIGYPVANTTLYVLDEHLNPVPIGIPGELCVGGKGIARGYNGMPGRSAAVFVPDPFSTEPGGRLYKTGDLVRFQPDPDNPGNMAIEFIGRVDNQVKIRGFRIELGEIEAVIGRHPAVQESYLMVREDTPGDKRLIAYLVPKPGKKLSRLELRHFLQSHLPDYMMPAAFVVLEAFPLTPNGKVDWRNLPEPSLERPVLKTQYAAPTSKTETTIASIWQDVLQLQQVGRYDNFFDLGGNSLLLVKVHSRLQQTFERKIPIVQLFTSSTVADVAKYLEQEATNGVTKVIPDLAATLERGQRRRARTRRRNQ